MEWDEVLEKYGDVKVKFSSYYKYTFTFKGKTENNEEVICHVGWTPDDIYEVSVDTKEITIRELDPDEVEINGKVVYTDRW